MSRHNNNTLYVMVGEEEEEEEQQQQVIGDKTTEKVTDKTTLEERITALLTIKSSLSNQEIRKTLSKQRPTVQKEVLNKTLHQMKERGSVTFRSNGSNKLWSLIDVSL